MESDRDRAAQACPGAAVGPGPVARDPRGGWRGAVALAAGACRARGFVHLPPLRSGARAVAGVPAKHREVRRRLVTLPVLSELGRAPVSREPRRRRAGAGSAGVSGHVQCPVRGQHRRGAGLSGDPGCRGGTAPPRRHPLADRRRWASGGMGEGRDRSPGARGSRSDAGTPPDRADAGLLPGG